MQLQADVREAVIFVNFSLISVQISAGVHVGVGRCLDVFIGNIFTAILMLHTAANNLKYYVLSEFFLRILTL